MAHLAHDYPEIFQSIIILMPEIVPLRDEAVDFLWRQERTLFLVKESEALVDLKGGSA